jgi:hypothetical protein
MIKTLLGVSYDKNEMIGSNSRLKRRAIYDSSLE